MLMDSNIVLDVRNVYKKYGKNNSATRNLLKDELKYIFTKNKVDKLRKGEFWVLNNISFQLKRGETLGILGLNGSGKSTLLKMINGLLLPDFGEITMDGEVGGFIELGAGFQSELSGKQNIFIKGALLGKSREMMNELYESIVDFAEIGEFINSPVKNYSSGMKARLGFGILVHIKPDILLMDEVLAVGDYKFRAKCMSKLNELRDHISSILVSHSMQDIRQYCDRAIILEKGNMVFSGKVDDAIEFYMEKQNKQEKKEVTRPKIKPFYGDLLHNKDKVTYIKHNWENYNIDFMSTATLKIEFTLNYNPSKLQLGIPIWDSKGNYIAGFDSFNDNFEIVSSDNKYSITLILPKVIFANEEYTTVVVLVDRGESLYRGILEKHLIIAKNKISHGLTEPEHEWNII